MKAKNRILTGTLILLFCVNLNTVNGQESGTLKSDSLYFESPALFSCNIQFPNDYDSEKALPLLISLHGGGSSYNSFKNLWNRFESPQFIMATPQAPYKWLMEDKIGYDWAAWPTGDLVLMQKALKLTSNYIDNLIQSLTDKYNISEVYLMGFSQGSIITQVAGINNHDLLDGIIILSGPEINHPGKSEIVWPSEETVQFANHLRVFIAHGKSDEIVDIEFANKSKVQYEKIGYNVSFFEFEGGHEINVEAMKEIEKWIKNQK
ncbi:MAG: alpha/beta hydrolase [Cyclobacteriaceae bacterium]|nr:alpha/beta hydrolase [Cyclobacteriaceae bacterium]